MNYDPEKVDSWVQIIRYTADFHGCKDIEEEVFGIDSPYIIRYRKDGCTQMSQHCDESVITLNIKLNSDYEGCNVIFPRQSYSLHSIPVGHAAIWPGHITHPHYVNKLTEGVKYSFVAFGKSQSMEIPSYQTICGYRFK